MFFLIRNATVSTVEKKLTRGLRAVVGTLLFVGIPAWALPASTMTTLAVASGGSAVTTVPQGSVVTLTATVVAGTTAVTPGLVNFCDASAASCTDIHLLGSAQLTSAGTAVTRFVPAVGSHSYKAVFVGTNAAGGSASAAAALKITSPGTGGGPFPTTTAAFISSEYAGIYTMTATVTGTGAAPSSYPTGSIAVLDTSNGNSVLGTGTLVRGFSLAPPLTASAGAMSGIAVGDFNGDGRLDLVEAYGTTLETLLGNGDGTFTSVVQTSSVGNSPSSIVVADFNGDGQADVAVANAGDNTVTVLLGNGDGTFTVAASPATGRSPSAIAAGDFNGDGKADLVIANTADNTITVLLGNGDGTFTAAASTATGNAPGSLAVGDFNGDGKEDLAIANGGDGTVMVLLGSGNGTFTVNTTIPSAGNGITPAAVAVGDFNGDGKQTLLLREINRTAITSPTSSYCLAMEMEHSPHLLSHSQRCHPRLSSWVISMGTATRIWR